MNKTSEAYGADADEDGERRKVRRVQARGDVPLNIRRAFGQRSSEQQFLFFDAQHEFEITDDFEHQEKNRFLTELIGEIS